VIKKMSYQVGIKCVHIQNYKSDSIIFFLYGLDY